MGKKGRFHKSGRAAVIVFVFCMVLLSTKITKDDPVLKKSSFMYSLRQELENRVLSLWTPILVYADGDTDFGSWTKSGGFLTLFSFLEKEEPVVLQAESGWTRDEIIRAEGRDEYAKNLPAQELEAPNHSDGRLTVHKELEQQLREENQRAMEEDKVSRKQQTEQSGQQTGNSSLQTEQGSQPPETASEADGQDTLEKSDKEKKQEALIDAYMALPTEKQAVYQWQYYDSFDSLVSEFYAVDASTVIDENQLNLEDLLTPKMSITKRTDDKPQILIYHTHSQEAFSNSVEGDPSTTIMGVGQVLAQILEQGYGYNVMHHLGQYDVENRDYAYNTALPVLEQLLEEYPTIEVILDLHRDEVAEGTHLVTEIEGRRTARFMFFNGLSRTRKLGDIEYLPNENIVANLAFSFQMQALCNQYYPGLTRRLYLKGYRYNMHLKPRYLLIEMGAQNNTYQECYNACIPLARMLDMELSGAEFGYTAE